MFSRERTYCMKFFLEVYEIILFSVHHIFLFSLHPLILQRTLSIKNTSEKSDQGTKCTNKFLLQLWMYIQTHDYVHILYENKTNCWIHQSTHICKNSANKNTPAANCSSSWSFMQRLVWPAAPSSLDFISSGSTEKTQQIKPITSRETERA